MMLWLRVSVIFKNKAGLHTQKGANLGLKCVRMLLAAGLRPGPLGELERSPDPLAAIGDGCLLLTGREEKGMGKGKEGDGKGEWRKEKGRRERADPRPGLRKCKGGNPKVWESANYA